MQWPDARYRPSANHPPLTGFAFKPKFVFITNRYQTSAKAGIIRVYNANFLD
jgi:hypothetical protein